MVTQLRRRGIRASRFLITTICPLLTIKRVSTFSVTAPPFPVPLFGCAPLLPPARRRSFHRRSCQSWLCVKSRRRRAARDRPEQLSRILFLEENRRCTRCHDKFRCDLFVARSLLPR